ncbi:MAG: fumarylacetoacetate hydrolase family protein [Roseovarius sp.]|uniref:fumarylacetoacetate hydrolase family protein n=1 Tax=Roseovarius sp. TaxID=1486281 RepID=UPI0032EE28F5
MPAEYLFDAPEQPVVPVEGEAREFPVRRIFCVGRNYAAHAAEMGGEVDREAPFYFTKSAHALCLSGGEIDYPPGTADCHHEVELVVALDRGGFEVEASEAMGLVYGYACGIDLTRRDLQAAAKDKRRPWDLGKDFENAAIIGTLTPKAAFGEIGGQRIVLRKDGAVVQEAVLSEMVWSVPELIAHLSRFYTLAPGDLIYTGTPAGVGPVQPGSVLEGEVDGLSPLRIGVSG